MCNCSKKSPIKNLVNRSGLSINRSPTGNLRSLKQPNRTNNTLPKQEQALGMNKKRREAEKVRRNILLNRFGKI
jgi:hypothetical protein